MHAALHTAYDDPGYELWKQVFQELIQEVKPWHKWTLTEDKDLLPNSLEPGWLQYQQWAFARFQCSLCSRSWASSQVQVLFHMHKSRRKPKGNVKMRVFAQRCQKCNQSPFEVPEFTKENISRILSNLVFRILKKCYREGFKSMEEIPTIKEISLEGPHDSNNCEACLQGFCAQSGLDEAVQSLVSPSLPAIRLPALETTIPMPSPTRSGTTADPVKGNFTVDTGKRNTTADIVKGKAMVDAMKRNATVDIEKGKAMVGAMKRNATVDIEKGKAMVGAMKRNDTVDIEKGKAMVGAMKRNDTVDIEKGKAMMGAMKRNDTVDIEKGKAMVGAMKRNDTVDIVKGKAMVGAMKRNATVDIEKGKAMVGAMKRNDTVDIVKGNATVETVKGNTVGNKGKALPQPWHSGSQEAAILPTHWSPRANAQHHAERRAQVRTWSESSYFHTAENPRCRNLNACCCFFILIVVVVIIVETIEWIST